MDNVAKDATSAARPAFSSGASLPDAASASRAVGSTRRGGQWRFASAIDAARALNSMTRASKNAGLEAG